MKRPLEIFLFNGCESQLCKSSHSYLADLLSILEIEVLSAVPSLKGNEINIVISDGRTMRGLNYRFRGKNEATDVLSFPLDEDVLGEVWISPVTIERNAKKYSEPYEKELMRVIVHGILHLAGYDHAGSFRADDAKLEPMFRIQEEIVARISEHRQSTWLVA